jgi:hypothetical protein
VRACAAYEKLRGDMEIVDQAIAALSAPAVDALTSGAMEGELSGHGINGVPVAAFGPHTDADRIDHCGACGVENEPQSDDICPSCGASNSLISTWGELQHARFRNGQRYANNGPQPWENGPQDAAHPASEPQSEAGELVGDACPRCGGSGFVPDGEITGSGGIEYENGPVQCVKDCPVCTAHSASGPKAEAIHYPECWDTAAYPTVESALSEVYAAFKCTNHIVASEPKALTLLDSIIRDMEGGFVKCENCGEQEYTATLDFMPMLRELRALLSDRGS